MATMQANNEEYRCQTMISCLTQLNKFWILTLLMCFKRAKSVSWLRMKMLTRDISGLCSQLLKEDMRLLFLWKWRLCCQLLFGGRNWRLGMSGIGLKISRIISSSIELHQLPAILWSINLKLDSSHQISSTKLCPMWRSFSDWFIANLSHSFLQWTQLRILIPTISQFEVSKEFPLFLQHSTTTIAFSKVTHQSRLSPFPTIKFSKHSHQHYSQIPNTNHFCSQLIAKCSLCSNSSLLQGFTTK